MDRPGARRQRNPQERGQSADSTRQLAGHVLVHDLERPDRVGGEPSRHPASHSSANRTSRLMTPALTACTGPRNRNSNTQTPTGHRPTPSDTSIVRPPPRASNQHHFRKHQRRPGHQYLQASGSPTLLLWRVQSARCTSTAERPITDGGVLGWRTDDLAPRWPRPCGSAAPGAGRATV
jgi:hypothetical protein